MKPTTRQKMAKPIPTTKPTRKPKNNTKHQRGDKNGLKLTGPPLQQRAKKRHQTHNNALLTVERVKA
jgi:hypothetical protein